jgi:hypothetical protein
MGSGYVLQLFVKIHDIADYLATTEGRVTISTDLECLNLFWCMLD